MKSDYELLREQKIARNQSRLAQLGLLKVRNNVYSKKRSIREEASNKRRLTKRISTEPVLSSITKIQSIPTRRSTRIKNKNTIGSYDEENLPKTKSAEEETNETFYSIPTTFKQKAKSKRIKPTNTTLGKVYQSPPIINKSTSSSASIPKARTTSINVEKITNCLLGKELQFTGKAFAISTAVICSEQEDFDKVKHQPLILSYSISFNKYCGVLEWGNNSFFLWVNIDGKPNDAGLYNEFIDGGKQMTWFGGSKMHDETPLIKRLIATGKNADRLHKEEEASPYKPHGIILFCRLMDEKKRAKPYVCLGRVGYHSHVPGSRPLQFVWNLLDFKRLEHDSKLQMTKNEDLSLFQEIVNF